MNNKEISLLELQRLYGVLDYKILNIMSEISELEFDLLVISDGKKWRRVV